MTRVYFKLKPVNKPPFIPAKKLTCVNVFCQKISRHHAAYHPHHKNEKKIFGFIYTYLHQSNPGEKKQSIPLIASAASTKPLLLFATCA
jgi:hypothetical protein